MPEQNCPLCALPAGYEADDFGRRKKFDCPRCKYFFISPSTEGRVVTLSENERADLSMKSSQCSEKEVFIIHAEGNGDIKGNCKLE